MAFDAEYIMTQCDHKVRDELIAEASSDDIALLDDASQFGYATYGTARFGSNFYSFLSSYGAAGTYIEAADGSVTAIFSIPGVVASDPQVFVKKPDEYLRKRVPKYDATEYSTTLSFSDSLYLGEDPLYLGGAAAIPSSSVSELWYVAYESTVESGVTVDANSLVIHRYDSQYDIIMDYVTIQDACPFCAGTGIRNDLILSPVGRLKLVYDIDKLAQTVVKAVSTRQGKNVTFPSYGTILPDMIGEKNINGYIIREQIVSQLLNIKRIQQILNAQKPGFLTAREVFEDLIGIKVEETEDPRVIGLSFYIKNSALETYKSKTFKLSA